MPGQYIVVENAGYIGERDARKGFPNYHAALDWLNQFYDEDDRETLHPDICYEDENGKRNYDCY